RPFITRISQVKAYAEDARGSRINPALALFVEDLPMSITVTPRDPTIAVGVGFDTARYGHHVTFLRADLQPACPAFEFPESRAGYERVLRQFQDLTRPDATVHFHIRLDAAGQYATNLETFLRSLPFPKTLTVGEPARNQDYRKALFPK